MIENKQLGRSFGLSEKSTVGKYGHVVYNNMDGGSHAYKQVTKEEKEKKYLEELQKRTLQKSMSYANALISQNRIVMSSDSRSVIIRDDKIIKYNDNFQKIVFLPLLKVGLVLTGINLIDDLPITDFLLQNDMEKTGSVSEKLENIALLLQQHISEQKGAYINIACGGFENGAAALYFTDIRKGQDFVIHQSELLWEAGAVCRAIQMFRKNFSQGNGECTISGDLCIDFCSAKDMIEFSNFLVRTNMFVDKKINGIPATGGSVQTLLLENGTAHWISHLY